MGAKVLLCLAEGLVLLDTGRDVLRVKREVFIFAEVRVVLDRLQHEGAQQVHILALQNKFKTESNKATHMLCSVQQDRFATYLEIFFKLGSLAC